MCLPNFIKFKKIPESNPIVGYRSWRVNIENPDNLISLYSDYNWNSNIGRHNVNNFNSGIYAYNFMYTDYYYNYYYNNNNNYYYNYGIIHQYGKVAIHKDGQRSEYCKIITLFTIRKSDAKGPKEFLDWIDNFNPVIEKLAKKYKCNTMHYQDF